MLLIREATPDDVTLLRRLIQELAEYENELERRLAKPCWQRWPGLRNAKAATACGGKCSTGTKQRLNSTSHSGSSFWTIGA